MSFLDSAPSRRADLFDGREEEKDFSDLATKEALKHLYEARERGVDTLASLNEQGERIERMQGAADRMHSKLDETDKALKDMESGFGFFRPSKRKRPAGFAATGSTFDTPYDVCGTLLKQSDVLKRWNTRWFFLVEKRLLYWKSQAEANANKPPRGVLELEGAHISLVPPERAGRDFVFEIRTPKRAFWLAATTQKPYRAWYTALSQHLILFGGTTDLTSVIRAGHRIKAGAGAAVTAHAAERRAHEGEDTTGGTADLISSDNLRLKMRAREMDRDVHEMGGVLRDLDGISRTMGAEIDSHMVMLDRLGGDVAEVDDKMVAQGRRAHRLNR